MGTLVAFFAELVVYLAIYTIVTWGLNIQYGYAGIMNFTYFTFVAIGAYVYGVTSLGTADPATGVTYILGLGLPFPIPMFIAGFVVGVLGFFVGLVALRRLRAEFMGIALLSIGLVIYSFVSNYPPLFDAANGLYNVPQPFFGQVTTDPNTYSVFYIVIASVVALICYMIMHRVDQAPLGRLMRATREDVDTTESIGKNSFKIRMTAMVLGCIFGGIGGSLLIAYNTTIDPGSWMTVETFVVWTTLMMGGAGNNFGAIISVLILYDVVGEPTRLLPTVASDPSLFSALRYVLIGVVLLLVLRFRPRGILPERRPSARWLLGSIGVGSRDVSGK